MEKKTKKKGRGMALTAPPTPTLPSDCFPLFLLCVLITIISLALPEPFGKWKAGKKKVEEKKKEERGKKDTSLVPTPRQCPE